VVVRGDCGEEVGWCVLEWARACDLFRIVAAGAVVVAALHVGGPKVVGGGGCGAEDFVFGGDFGEFALEAFVFVVQGGGGLFEVGEFGFKFFDVAFFAFAEGSLAVGGIWLAGASEDCRGVGRYTLLYFAPFSCSVLG
jgi:hypothetical protein